MPVTLPGTGIAVASVTRSAAEYQLTAVYPRGTAVYDSGLTAMPAATTLLTGTTSYIDVFYFYNGTDEAQTVTLENAAQTLQLLAAFPLEPRSFISVDRKGASLVGIRWHASHASVMGQVTAWQ